VRVNSDRSYVVVARHVDHLKSMLVRCLLADAGFLPEGKVEAVGRLREGTAKAFEYAFRVGALGEGRAQGVATDVARGVLRTFEREYVFRDASRPAQDAPDDGGLETLRRDRYMQNPSPPMPARKPRATRSGIE